MGFRVVRVVRELWALLDQRDVEEKERRFVEQLFNPTFWLLFPFVAPLLRYDDVGEFYARRSSQRLGPAGQARLLTVRTGIGGRCVLCLS